MPKDQEDTAGKDDDERDEEAETELVDNIESYQGMEKEARAMMKILCAHLLPVGLAKSATRR